MKPTQTTAQKTPKQLQQENKKKGVLAKELVKNNPIFDNEQALQIFDAFESFLDPRTKLMSLSSLLSCATTLGLDEKYPTLMNIIVSIEKESPQVDYDTFLKELTQRLGNVRTKEGRTVLFSLLDKEKTQSLTIDNLKSLAKEVGHIVSEDDLQEIFQAITKGETITLEEFEKYLAKKVERNL